MSSLTKNKIDILEDKDLRKLICERSIRSFVLVYLGHYINYKFDKYHDDIFELLQNDEIKRASILGFRECAKSAIVNTVYVLWNVLYKKRNFILLGSEEGGLSNTQTTSVAYELLYNENIIRDFGKLYYDEKEGMVRARQRSINDFTCSNNVRVKAISSGMKVRGLRHNQLRPDLVILDDMDTTKSVINEKVREVKYNWFKSEILPGMNQSYGKCIVLGNMVHYDCFMARIQKEEGWSNLNIPIYNNKMEIAWSDKYVMKAEEAMEINKSRDKSRKVISVEEIKKDKGSRVFGQEYLLVPATDEDRIFKLKFIEQCLDFERTFLEHRPKGVYSIVTQGNDLAISQKESSDTFAIVTLGKEGNKTVILNIFADKGLSPNQQKAAVTKQVTDYDSDIIYIEDNAYQAFFSKLMQEETDLPIRGFTTAANKRDEIQGINNIALALENKNYIIPYGDDHTKELIDRLIKEMQEYPDGHTGDILMALWFAHRAMKDTDPQAHLMVEHTGLEGHLSYEDDY